MVRVEATLLFRNVIVARPYYPVQPLSLVRAYVEGWFSRVCATGVEYVRD